MRFSFTTEDIEPAGRFEGFRDHLVRRLFQLDLVDRSQDPYRGIVELDVTGSAVFGRVCGSAADFIRSRDVARRCEEGAWLLLAREGRVGVAQGDVEAILNPGEGIVFDAGDPHFGRCLGQSDTWIIQVRDDVIRPPPPRDLGARTQLLDSRARTYAPLLIAMLEAHFERADPGDTRASEALGRYLSEIVALQLGARDGVEAARESVMEGRRQAILARIRARASDPNFDSMAMARELGVTRRYVNLLLERTGRSFSEHLLSRRLEIALALLAVPSRRTIASIALEAGFGDVSYFNRVFRRQFGDTPGNFQRDRRER